MKRVLFTIAIIASLFMLMLFVGCSESQEPATDETTPAETVVPETTAPAEAEPVTAIDWQRKGVDLILAGKDDEALTAFNKAIELDPALTITYYNRAEIYKKRGLNDKALADYKVACDAGWDVGCTGYKKLGGK